MIIREYDGLNVSERERHARVALMARNVLAKQHGMVADIEPSALRKRAAELALVGLDPGIRAF